MMTNLPEQPSPFFSRNSQSLPPTVVSSKELFLRHLFASAVTLPYALLEPCEGKLGDLIPMHTMYLLSERELWDSWAFLFERSPYVQKTVQKERGHQCNFRLTLSDGSECQVFVLDSVRLEQYGLMEGEAILFSASKNEDQVKVPALEFLYEFWLSGWAQENPNAYHAGLTYFCSLPISTQRALRGSFQAKQVRKQRTLSRSWFHGYGDVNEGFTSFPAV